MTIGLDTGEQFESRFEQFANSYHTADAELDPFHNKIEGKDQSRVPQRFDTEKQIPGSQPRVPADRFSIDRDHHVPLVASAIVGSDGSMAGLAIDHRVPPNPEYEQFLAMHEGAELSHMNNLVQAGMKPQEAYHEAHDKIATPIETAAVRAHATRTGQDPDEYLDRYKQFWRDAAKMAAEPSDRSVHPDAHTTRFGLDKAELPHLAINLPPGEDSDVPLLGANDNQPGQTPEEHEHLKALHSVESILPFAMTRALGSSRPMFGRPANSNAALYDDPKLQREIVENAKKPTLEEWEKTNPDLVKYAKALNKQQKPSKRSEMYVDEYSPGKHLIQPKDLERLDKARGPDFKYKNIDLKDIGKLPKAPEGKTTIDRLREWFLDPDKE